MLGGKYLAIYWWLCDQPPQLPILGLWQAVWLTQMKGQSRSAETEQTKRLFKKICLEEQWLKQVTVELHVTCWWKLAWQSSSPFLDMGLVKIQGGSWREVDEHVLSTWPVTLYTAPRKSSQTALIPVFGNRWDNPFIFIGQHDIFVWTK